MCLIYFFFSLWVFYNSFSLFLATSYSSSTLSIPHAHSQVHLSDHCRWTWALPLWTSSYLVHRTRGTNSCLNTLITKPAIIHGKTLKFISAQPNTCKLILFNLKEVYTTAQWMHTYLHILIITTSHIHSSLFLDQTFSVCRVHSFQDIGLKWNKSYKSDAFYIQHTGGNYSEFIWHLFENFPMFSFDKRHFKERLCFIKLYPLSTRITAT